MATQRDKARARTTYDREYKRRYREKQRQDGKCVKCGMSLSDPFHDMHHRRSEPTHPDAYERLLMEKIAVWQDALAAYRIAKKVDAIAGSK